uniref:Cytochrome c oxidase subunit NDUFA4 n=1 Tax=Oryctolagus cuniculus TaxID=9986 RepID=G1T6W3_RABIT
MLRQIIGQAKKHPSLIPLFIFIGAGGTGAALYVMRLALFNPDVSWDRKNNLEPWNKLGPNDQYKFYSVNVDYSKLKKEGLPEAIHTIFHLTRKYFSSKCMQSC